MRNEVPNKGLEWTNLFLGAALACAALMSAGLPVAAWNAGIVGMMVMFCSIGAVYAYGEWTEWSNLALGCWSVVAPFVLGFGAAQTPMWTHVVVGGCVATIATIQLVLARRAHPSSNFD